MTQLATDEEVGIGADPALMGDAEVGLPPTGDLPTPPSDSDEKIGPTNYGRFAAARIAQARFKAQAQGNDLSNPEQLAIMDAYRQAAGLPTLSNVDSFKEAQQYIARHQSDVLNLARSTSAAFERFGVDKVSEIVDKLSPGWGTEMRQNIAATNPFDPDRLSGKAGGIVASLPMLLAGGGATKLAAVFGLDAMTEALATSTDTGVTGTKKWLGSAAQGATTATTLYLGGKLSEWAVKGLAGRIPELQRLLTAGATDTAATVVARQAAIAGITLPPTVASMIAGKIGDNLIAAQSIDPNREWHDGLDETGYMAAVMVAGQAVAGIPGGIKGARTARGIEAGPRPGDIGPTVYTPPAGRVSEVPLDASVTAAPTDYPAGRLPTILTEHPASTMTGGPSISNIAIQGTAGTAEHPEVVYIDKGLPRVLDIGTKPVDIHSFVAVHETTERKLLDAGQNYEEAHPQAQAAEHAALQRAGIDPIAYEKALEPYEKIAQGRKLSESPGDLDMRPYRNLPKDRDRPKSIVTTEGNINNTPEGRELAIPHAYYVTADRMSPAGAKEFGSAFIENAGDNLWVRPSAEASNAKRTLLIHISDALTRTEPPTAGDSRVVDFKEPPEWIGRAAENLPDSDVYVVRNPEEVAKFLDQAKYEKVAFSASEKDSPIIQKVLEGYKGKASIIGTPTDTLPFRGKPDRTVHQDTDAWLRSQGQTPKDGTDFRHFRDTAPPVDTGQGPDPGLLARLHSDETGAIPAERLLNTLGAEDVRAMGRAAVDTIRSAAEDAQRTFAAGTRGEGARATEAAVRQGEGRAARRRDIRQQAFGKAKEGMDKYARVNGQKAVDDYSDLINQGKKQTDPSLQGIADAQDADRRDLVARMKALGTGAAEKFEDNWAGRQWKDQDRARQFFASRRPLTGPKTFLKGRTLESIAEGRAMGLELITDNPLEMWMFKADEMEKYIEGVNSLKQLEAQHFAERIKSGDAVPRDWQRIHDQIGLYKAKNPVTGEQETGSFYAPEKVATVINNHLSPGLMNKAWFRTYMSAANWQNQFQLGLSSFHLFTTAANAVMSQFALGLREGFQGGKQILHGDVVGGAENIGRGLVSAVTSPLAPVFTALRGHEGLAEWRSPGTESPLTQRIVNLMADANARAQSDPFYRTHITDKMMSAFRQGNILGGLGRALFLPIEVPTRAIMDYVVPHFKFGASMDLIAMELRNNPGISHEALLAKTRSAWDSADNRMGQLVYNNLYWNQTTKHIAMAMVRSVGWNLGTFRELVGGTYDLAKMSADLLRGKPVDLTNRAAYTLALPMVHAAIGAFLNYVFTGEGPQDLKDCMFPRTGEKDEHGNPQRVSLWTYMKDVYHYGTDWKGTLAGKLHPMVQGLYSMVTNKDFYGEKIRNEDDPFMQQVKQSVVAAAKSFEPLSSRNVRRGLEMGETPAQLSRTAIGLTPAPLAINQSPAEQRASEIIREKTPVGARTREEVERTHLKHDLARKFAAGDTDAIPSALQADQISKDDAKAILKESRQKPLQVQIGRLDAKEALQVWMKATPEERASIRVQLLKHLSGMKGHATIAERKEMIEQYRLAGVLQ
jgi:hypothetical protein